jgi:hypothetical protein
MRIQTTDGGIGLYVHVQAFDLGSLGGGQRFGRDVQLDVAQRKGLAGQTIALLQIAGRKFGLFF